MEAAFDWIKAQQIAGDKDVNLVNTQFAIDDKGNIVVVWEEVEGTSGDSNKGSIKGGVLNLINGQLSFKEKPTLISRPNVASYPRLSMNGNGKAVAIWLEGTSIEMSTLQTTVSSKWSLPTTIFTYDKYGAETHLAVDDQGNTLILWLDDYEGHAVRGCYLSYKDGSEWTDLVVSEVNDENKLFKALQIAMNGGIAAAVWELVIQNGEELTSVVIEGAITQISEIEGEDNEWNAFHLSEELGFSYAPQVAVGSITSSKGAVSGRAVAIWRFLNKDNSYSIQCTNNLDGKSVEDWAPAVTLTNNVKNDGYQSIAVESGSDLAFAYWSIGDIADSDPNNIQISESSLSKPSWSDLFDFAFYSSLGPYLDATIFKGTPLVIWLQDKSIEVQNKSINVGYADLQTPSYEVSILTTNNASFPDEQRPMIGSNDKQGQGIIVAMWLENILLEDGSIVQGLMAATGKQISETSKMLIHWGVDEALQSDLP